MDEMLRAYIRCALWSTNDESDEQGGDPLDRYYTVEDIHPDTLDRMRVDCANFYLAHADLIGEREEDAGHDLWLTRNGHGTGFWDGDWPEHGERLTEAAKAMGEVHLYVGDNDAKIRAL